MEALLEQVAQLPGLLAVSRSALVRAWDAPTLGRALEWARYFQHLHGRFRARPRLRAALGRRLRQGQPGSPLGFRHLGRCAALLGLALLENRALPPAACRRLLQSLLRPGAAAEAPSLALLARRKAASRLLAPAPRPAGSPAALEPQVRAEAQMLLARLREEEEEAEPGGGRAGEARERLRWVAGLLEQLPQPRALRVVAAALQQQRGGDEEGLRGRAGGGHVAGPLLSWLLESQERFSAFCLLLPGSLLASLAAHYSQLRPPYLDLLTAWGSRLLYDPLQGRWHNSCLGEAELSWEELRERFDCLCRGPALLRGQTRAALELLKVQDGDFHICGLSVWTDLLMEVEKSLRKEEEQ
ncbi:Fanconi anemia group F protein [Dromaius novaehollandiae]|uniref:Fanconi anemia group F protein n=1 Tax=Dromaius novaehollandiae TaxID=8790 RepID=UPI000E1F40DE|nr:Fanconi anemia group F protein [Dromaius novaehollandiae]